MKVKTRSAVRNRIQQRIRKKIRGTEARPRLAVFRSQNHIYAQIVDDDQGRTLCSASSLDGDVKGKAKRGGTIAAASEVGGLIAGRAREKGIADVVFDRGGFQFHGRVKALAEAAREGGLKF